MPVQSREQLKNYFRNGTLVREEHFADLIDSTVNKVNDNIETGADTGFGLTPSLSGKKFISFFKNSSRQHQNMPSFALQLAEGHNGSGDGLSLSMGNGRKDDLKNLLFLKAEITQAGIVQGKVGINTSKPTADLDVNGSVGMKSRIGRYNDPAIDPRSVVADGKWHKLVTNLKGINSFEILSVVCSPDGKHAMYYGILMNAFGKTKRERPIRQQYKRWWHRIQIRWVPGPNGTYGLEIRTACDYKSRQVITSRITKLWS